MSSSMHDTQIKTTSFTAVKADGKLLETLLKTKPELLKISNQDLLHLMDEAFDKNDMSLAENILTQNPALLNSCALEGSAAPIIELCAKAIEKKNFSIIKILLKQYPPLLFNEMPLNVQKSLLDIAINANDVELVMTLLSSAPGLLTEIVSDSYSPIVSAAKKGKWGIVAAIAAKYSTEYPNLNSADFHKALLMALDANTPQSHSAAQKFNLNSVCSTYKWFHDRNNILHHAMGGEDLNSIIHILTKLENKERLREFVRSRNAHNQTPMELAAQKENWPAVALHAALYTPASELDAELYRKVIALAIAKRIPAALQAAVELIAALKLSQQPSNLDWITLQINNAIVGRSMVDPFINKVFSSLLGLAENDSQRVAIITELSVNSKKGSIIREEYRKNMKEAVKENRSTKKDNIVDLISQISDPMLKIDIILDFLKDKGNIIWLKAGHFIPTLLDGTREKLILILINEFKQIDLSQHDPAIVAGFITKATEIFKANGVDSSARLNIQLMTALGETLFRLLIQIEAGEFISIAQLIAERCPTVKKLSRFVGWKDEVSMNILKDFLLIIANKAPQFQQQDAGNHLEEVTAAILKFYGDYIQKNGTLQKIFLGHLLSCGELNKDSAILSALKEVAQKDYVEISRPYPSLRHISALKEKEVAKKDYVEISSLYPSLGHNGCYQPSAPTMSELLPESKSGSALTTYSGTFLASTQSSGSSRDGSLWPPVPSSHLGTISKNPEATRKTASMLPG